MWSGLFGICYMLVNVVFLSHAMTLLSASCLFEGIYGTFFDAVLAVVLQHSLPSSSGDVCAELADARSLLNASFHVSPIEVRAR